MREGKIESGYSIKSLEGLASRLHDLGAELGMHSLTLGCGTIPNEEKLYICPNNKYRCAKYTVNGFPLNCVSGVKYLGASISSKMS